MVVVVCNMYLSICEGISVPWTVKFVKLWVGGESLYSLFLSKIYTKQKFSFILCLEDFKVLEPEEKEHNICAVLVHIQTLMFRDPRVTQLLTCKMVHSRRFLLECSWLITMNVENMLHVRFEDCFPLSSGFQSGDEISLNFVHMSICSCWRILCSDRISSATKHVCYVETEPGVLTYLCQTLSQPLAVHQCRLCSLKSSGTQTLESSFWVPTSLVCILLEII